MTTNTQLNIRVGQALNITCARVSSEGLEKIPRNFWERVEDLLPSTYENLERLHKKQVDAVLNKPDVAKVTFEEVIKIIPTLKTVEQVEQFKKDHMQFLKSCTPDQRIELTNLITV